MNSHTFIVASFFANILLPIIVKENILLFQIMNDQIYILQSKTDGVSFEVNKNIIESSTLLKNLCGKLLNFKMFFIKYYMEEGNE